MEIAPGFLKGKLFVYVQGISSIIYDCFESAQHGVCGGTVYLSNAVMQTCKQNNTSGKRGHASHTYKEKRLRV